MRQWVVIACGLLLYGATAHAVPARTTPVVVYQADGTTITVRIHGDEYSNWTSTLDGYQIVQQEGVYYYYESSVSRSTVRVKASDPSARSTNEIWALTGRNTGQLDGRIGANTERMTYPLIEQLSASKAEDLKPVTTPKHSLVLLVQFQDVSFQPAHTQAVFDQLLNQGSQSARQYFSDNSQGAYTPTFDVKGPYTLPHQVAYYGAKEGTGANVLEDRDPQQMVIDACKAAQSGLDFSQYDENKDHTVDNIYIIYAGVNQAEDGREEQTIWPHRWTLQGKPDTRFNGVKVWDYACGSELSTLSSTKERTLAGIGTFCHEFGHVLGLPDMYDTDKTTNGQSVGLYHFSIMSTGNYNNAGHTPPYYTALERWLLGWGSLRELTSGQQITLGSVEQSSTGWYIPTEDPGEFYVVEGRGASLWDAYLGGTGLLIYHIDRSNTSVGGTRALDRWRLNTVNSVASHPCARLIESGGQKLSSLVNPPTSFSQVQSLVGKVFYPGSVGTTTFTGRSYGGIDWRGNAIAVELTGITNNNGTISLATRTSQGTGRPLSFKVFQRSVIVTISPTLYKGADVSTRYVLELKPDSKMGTKIELKDNPTSVTALALLPDTHYTVTLWATPTSSTAQSVVQDSFTTYALSAPYPAISGLKGNITLGSVIHLGITNLPSTPSKVAFSINGAGIEGQSYTFNAKGRYTVRCTITYSIEDVEIIERTITVS